MNIFAIFILQNFIKIFSKTHQIAPFKKIFSGEHAPNKHCSKNYLDPLPQKSSPRYATVYYSSS